nr:unnamed protein product [Spirometra erinaceieuropaei]
MKDAWMVCKAEDIRGYADRNESEGFFAAIRAIYRPPTKGTAPLLSSDGSTLLTEKSQILWRWTEHFRIVFNRPFTFSTAQVKINTDLEFILSPQKPSLTSSGRHFYIERRPGPSIPTVPQNSTTSISADFAEC